MSDNFNKKIAPMKNFRLSGMLWYQGETEIILGSSYGEYSKQLDLLQRSYSELFGYEGALPLVYTQLAAYGYANDFRLQQFNMELAEFQNEAPDSRALISIYDIPLTYDANAGAIHPLVWDSAGERMAFYAEGLVYGKHDCYTAAAVDDFETADSAIYVTLKNTGDGSTSDGKTISCLQDNKRQCIQR